MDRHNCFFYYYSMHLLQNLYELNTSDVLDFISYFIRSGYFCGASSSPLLLRGAPNYSIDTMS